MPVVFRSGSTRVTSSVLRFDGGSLAVVNGEAVYTPPGGGGGVPASRAISTTSPLQGGGDLSANRTLSILTASSTQAGALSASDWATFDARVAPTRSIFTTAPLSGGGNLSADRTLALTYSTGLTVSGGSLVVDATVFATVASVAAGYQPLDADITALGALGNGLPYRSGGTWGATALGDLAISGASVQVAQARGLRETAGPTTLSMGAVGAGELLIRSGATLIGAAIGVVVQAYSAILQAIANLSTTGLIVRSGAGTVETRTITTTDLQISVVNGNGVSGDPDISIKPGFLSGEYYSQWFGTEGVTITGTLPTTTGAVTFTILGTNNLPQMNASASTAAVVGIRTNSALFCLAQGFTHRYQFVTGTTKTTVRWRVGLSGTTPGNALKPTTNTAMLVFDTDSAQANAATNWYLLTYDNGGGAVSYSDTGVACNVSTAYEAEITTDSTHVYARIRTAGGTWSGVTVSTTSLPASTTLMTSAFFVTPTVGAITRTLAIRSYYVWGRIA